MQERCDVYMCVYSPSSRPTDHQSLVKCVLVCYVLECTPCQQKTGGVPTLPRVFLLLTPVPAGPCRVAPTVCMMLLKGGGAGRGWSQVSWTGQSSLWSGQSMSLGVSSLRVSVPQCARCVPRTVESVPQCGGCVTVW